jgi:hypothetical protein
MQAGRESGQHNRRQVAANDDALLQQMTARGAVVNRPTSRLARGVAGRDRARPAGIRAGGGGPLHRGSERPAGAGLRCGAALDRGCG